MAFSTIFFFQFNDFSNKWWGFTQMRKAHLYLKNNAGQHFYKLLGSGGGNGFSLWPDWSTYVLLQSWENQESFDAFIKDNAWFREAKARAANLGSVKLSAYKAHGTWNNQHPFAHQKGNEKTPLIAILTRARIKPNLLHQFWRQVPGVSKHVFGFNGLIMAKGIGELPLIEQATFSIWDNDKLMQAFAYQDDRHASMVKKTRALDWYSEELFARFQVLEMSGTYKGLELGALFQNRKYTLQTERV